MNSRLGKCACLVIFGLVLVGLMGCTPTGGPVSSTRGPATATAVVEPPPVVVSENGWCAGGPEVLTVKDVGCYYVMAASAEFELLDEETAVIFAPLAGLDNWVGAAVIFHQPTESMLVLDAFGDIDPAASYFSSRAGLAALDDLTLDPNFMAGLKGQVQERNQTSPTNRPEVRLGVAWQDGDATVFLVSVAGLSSTDGRFYCPSQQWTIGDKTIAVEASCVERDPDAPVRMHFFDSFEVRGHNTRSVQVQLGAVASNVVQVSQGEMAEETAIYLEALKAMSGRSTLIRAETTAGLGEAIVKLGPSVDASLLADLLAANEKSHSLRFLFRNHNAYHVHPGEAIDRDFFSTGTSQNRCAAFNQEYPGLGGVVTISSIGYSEDGAQALVYAEKACGTTDYLAAFYLLEKTADDWQVRDAFEVDTRLGLLTPDFDYKNGRTDGCGDIFVYKSNAERTEYLLAGINLRDFGLSTEPQTVRVEDYPEAVQIRIDIYTPKSDRLGEFPYCNDVGLEDDPNSVWQAVSGTVTLSTTAENLGDSTCDGPPYEATVLLEDVTFKSGEESLTLASISFEGVRVGWCPG